MIVPAPGAGSPTHAGAVAYRDTPHGPQVLLVGARSAAGEWVLPKGHIEPGETAAAAARRELAEEAGVVGVVDADLGRVTYTTPGGRVDVHYYLVRCDEERAAAEGRRTLWLDPERAAETAAYDEARDVLARARRVLGRRTAREEEP